VSAPRRRSPIVIDTDVFSADLVPGSALTERYAPILAGRPAFISFQTAAEIRYGALRRGWSEARMLKLEAKLHRVEVVHSGPELVQVYARLRADCATIGHGLAQREHNADRWIAATALRLGVPLVSNDQIFCRDSRPGRRDRPLNPDPLTPADADRPRQRGRIRRRAVASQPPGRVPELL
jgi:predicted nucleic acid-binding protein